jgi:hypothetical protein
MLVYFLNERVWLVCSAKPAIVNVAQYDNFLKHFVVSFKTSPRKNADENHCLLP